MRYVIIAGMLALLGATPSPAPTGSPAPLTVHISEFKYKPVTVTIHVGDTVRFINDDGAAHTVTATGKDFDSGNLDQGQSWTRTFDKAGTYKYICTYHPFMKATVIVVAPSP